MERVKMFSLCRCDSCWCPIQYLIAQKYWHYIQLFPDKVPSLLSASLSVKKFHSGPPFSKTYNTVVSWMMLVIFCHSSARLMFCMFVECHLRFNCLIFSLSALHNLCIIFLSPVFLIDYKVFFPAVLQACLIIEFIAPKLSDLKTIYWALQSTQPFTFSIIFLSPVLSLDCINIYI